MMDSRNQSLLEKAELLSGMLNLSREGLCALDSDFKVVWANKAFVSLFSADCRSFRDINFFTLFKVGQRESVKEALKSAIEGSFFEQSIRIFAANQADFSAHLRCIPLTLGSTGVVGVSVSPDPNCSLRKQGMSFESTLAPRETQICHMVSDGMSSKEVAERLHISDSTVIKHRKNIRKKLGIAGKNINLVTYLRRVSL